ncbi:Dynein heavy chain 7 [Durusdinium trenchii]|uniref:Axonemal n=1 Tax=Durusdinium trenchii TaxID=1381693 RepID=A0ABP0IH75_9DINO
MAAKFWDAREQRERAAVQHDRSDSVLQQELPDSVVLEIAAKEALLQPFEPGKTIVSLRKYAGNGVYTWSRGVVLEVNRELATCLVKEGEKGTPGNEHGLCRWVGWEHVWWSDSENLQEHQARIRELIARERKRISGLLVDPNMQRPEHPVNESALFLSERFRTLCPGVVERIVLAAKPVKRPFTIALFNSLQHRAGRRAKVAPIYLPTPNSPLLWRSLLEEVHREYLETQFAIAVRHQRGEHAHQQETGHRSQLKRGWAGSKSVLDRARDLERRFPIFRVNSIAAMREIRHESAKIVSGTTLLDGSAGKNLEPVSLTAFKRAQSDTLSRNLARLRSKWVVTIYHILLARIMKDPTFKDQKSGPLPKLLRVIKLIVVDALADILLQTIKTLQQTFLQFSSPLFGTEVELRRVSRTEKIREQRRRQLKRQSTFGNASAADWMMSTLGTSPGSQMEPGEKDGVDPEEQRQKALQELEALRRDSEDISQGSLEDQDEFEFVVEPSAEDFILAICTCLGNTVRDLERFPSVDSLVLDDPHVPELMKLDLLERFKGRLCDVFDEIEESFDQAAEPLNKYCLKMTESLQSETAHTSSIEKVAVFRRTARDLLKHKCFGPFRLGFSGLRGQLLEHAQQERDKYEEAAIGRFAKGCDIVEAKYHQERAELTMMTRSAEDLEQLWKRVERVPERVAELEALVQDHVGCHFAELEHHQFCVPEDVWKRRWEVFRLPRKLWGRAQHVRADLESKKRELAATLSDQFVKHRKLLQDHAKTLSVVEAYSDLTRVEENAINSTLLEESIQEAHAKTLELHARAVLFDLGKEFEETLSFSMQLAAKIRPLALLWSTAADIGEIYALWYSTSLLKLETKELLTKAHEVASRDLGEIIRSNSQAAEIKGWIDRKTSAVLSTQRLVECIAAKGLQSFHWVAFSERNGTVLFEPSFETTLSQVLERHDDILEHLDDLEAVAQTASMEFHAENELDEMETRVKRWLAKDDQRAFWEFEVLVQGQLQRLCEMRDSGQVDSLLPRIRIWEEHLQDKFEEQRKQDRQEQAARAEEFLMLRRENPRLCLVTNAAMKEYAESGHDPFKLLPHLYPFYGIPTHKMKKTTLNRNLMSDVVNSETGKTKVGCANLFMGSVVNDIGESIQLVEPCDLSHGFEHCDHVVKATLQAALVKCLEAFKREGFPSVLPSFTSATSAATEKPREPPSFERVLHEAPKQILLLAVRILLSAISRQMLQHSSPEEARPAWRRAMEVWIQAAVCLHRSNPIQNDGTELTRRQLIARDLVFITANQLDLVDMANRELLVEFQMKPRSSDVLIRFSGEDSGTETLQYGFEVVSGKPSPFLVLQSVKWHLQLLKTLGAQGPSLLVQDGAIDGTLSFACDTGYFCFQIHSDNLESIMRAQRGIIETRAWAIVHERSSWQGLCHTSMEPNSILLATCKSKLPEYLTSKLKPLSVCADPDAIRRQCLSRVGLAPPAQRTTPRPSQVNHDHLVNVPESQHLHLYLSRWSDAKDWERRIKSKLRRTGEHSWSGKPSKVIVHDAKSVAERARNPECVSLIEGLQSPGVLALVHWHFVFHDSTFAIQPLIVKQVPTDFSSLSIVLLDPEQRDLVSYLESVPDGAAIHHCNEYGMAANPCLIVCFSDASKLASIEEDFPRVRREAKRFSLQPWWLDRKELSNKAEFDDEHTRSLLAKMFLEHIVRPGVRPTHFVEYVEQVRASLPLEMSKLLEESARHTEALEALGKLERKAKELAALEEREDDEDGNDENDQRASEAALDANGTGDSDSEQDEVEEEGAWATFTREQLLEEIENLHKKAPHHRAELKRVTQRMRSLPELLTESVAKSFTL